MAATVLSIDTIVSDPQIRGGRPTIAGRRITVSDLIARYVYHKMTPEEIAIQFALTLGQVHAALAYYYTHQKEIDDEIRQDEEEAERLLAELDRQGKLVRLE